MKILYDSESVRNAIIDSFRNSQRRRVAIVAFVSEGAESYLPNPSGLELYCWPKPGSTDPDTLVDLIERGTKVYFVDSLHMKVYYCEDVGAVITSANLSTNALGSGNLLEAGVFISADKLSIDEFLRTFESRPASPKELLRLEVLHKAYKSKNPSQFATSGRVVAFDKWYESQYSKPWKIAVIFGDVKLAKNARAISINEYAKKNPHSWISSDIDDYSKHDWILTFRVDKDAPIEIEWFSVDYSVTVLPKEYDGNRCQYIQVWPLDRYTRPPFSLDKVFKKCFREALAEYGSNRLANKKAPPMKFVELLYSNFKKK